MRHVLSLEYNAAVDSLLVTVAAVKESEHVQGTFSRQLGAPEPRAGFSLEDLPPEHAVAFRSLLGWLATATEEKHAAAAMEPAAIAARASAVAHAEHELRVKEETARQTLADLDAEIEKRRAALAIPASDAD
jgi:hypothetical protein